MCPLYENEVIQRLQIILQMFATFSNVCKKKISFVVLVDRFCFTCKINQLVAENSGEEFFIYLTTCLSCKPALKSGNQDSETENKVHLFVAIYPSEPV